MRYIAPVILLATIAGTLRVGRVGFTSHEPKSEFTFCGRGSLRTLDPAQMSWADDMRVASSLWEGLTTLDAATTRPIPGVAYLPPEISADGKRYLFTLRPDARWSNGEPVTAADFVRGWRRGIEPGTADAYAELIANHIAGADDYARWRAEGVSALGMLREIGKGSSLEPTELRKILLSEAGRPLIRVLESATAAEPAFSDAPPPESDPLWRELASRLPALQVDWKSVADRALDAHIQEMEQRFARVGVHAIDSHHLEVKLLRPTPYFFDLTSFPIFLPAHQSVELLRERYEQRPLTETGLCAYDPQWSKPDFHEHGYPGLVTNGPYVLKEWRFKQRMRFEANPYYWDRSNVCSQTISLLDIEYASTAFMLYEQGMIDWFTDMSMDYTPELVGMAREGRRNDIHAIPAFGTYYFTLNCRPTLPDGRANPIADPRVRRALTRTVRRADIAEHVARLGNPIATTFIPPRSIPGYRSPKGLDYDPELGRRELAEAGYPGGQGFPVLELLYNTGESHEAKAQALGRMWQQELGLRIALIGKEVKTFADDKDAGRFMAGRSSWFGDYTDPTTFLDLFQSRNGNNVGKFNDPKYDALLARAADETDPAKRLEILSEAERYVMEEQLPIIPLFQHVSVYAWRPNVTGIYANPRLQFPLQTICVGKQ